MITYKEIRDIKRHLAQTLRNDEWWEYHHRLEVSAVQVELGAQHEFYTEQEFYRKVNSTYFYLKSQAKVATPEDYK